LIDDERDCGAERCDGAVQWGEAAKGVVGKRNSRKAKPIDMSGRTGYHVIVQLDAGLKKIFEGGHNFYVYLARGLDRVVLKKYSGLPITEEAKTATTDQEKKSEKRREK